MYYELLKLLQNLCQKVPTKIENMLSIPIWYNAELSTKFDVELSRAGFNSIKDLFPNTELLTLNEPMVTQLRPVKRRLLIQIILKIPEWLGNAIENGPMLYVTVSPAQTINLNNSDVMVKTLNSGRIYSNLVECKVRLPRGLLHWCKEL